MSSDKISNFTSFVGSINDECLSSFPLPAFSEVVSEKEWVDENEK